MLNDQRPLKVFLCHAHDDKPRVRELYRALKRHKIDVWFNEADLLPGQDWDFEISKVTRATDAIVICISNTSISKEGYVQKEIRRTLDIADEKPEGAIFVIPVRLEECEIPFRLKKYHWVDLFSEGGLEKLLKALKARAEQVGRAKIAAPKAGKPAQDTPASSSQPQNVILHVEGDVHGNIVVGDENRLSSTDKKL